MLNERQMRFVDEYMIDLDATQAAIRAGCSVKTAYSQGQRLLKNVEIKTELDERMEKARSLKIADATEIMEYLTSVMRGESEAEVVVVEGCGEGVSSARTMQKAPDEKEKLKAAELLGKRYGMFNDKLNVDGVIPVVISGGDELED